MAAHAAGLNRAFVATAVGCLLATAVACGDSNSFIRITDTPAGAYEASLAAVTDGFITAWHDTRDGHAEIYTRSLDADGRPRGPERRLTTNRTADAYEADIVATPDGFVVGWYERNADQSLIPRIGSWERDGERQWSKALAPAGRNVVVRALQGLLFVAWVTNEGPANAGVWAMWMRTDGAPLVPPRRVADAGNTTWNLNAAIDPRSTPEQPRAWIAFDAKVSNRSEELYLVEVSQTGHRVVQVTPDDGNASKYPDLVLTPGDTGARAALTWFDVRDGNEEVYLAVGAMESLAHARLEPVRVTRTNGASIGAYAAWNGDRIGLAWCDDEGGNQELYCRTFDSQGRPEQEAMRLTETTTTSSIPAIRAWRDGFAIVWNEYEPVADGHGDSPSQIMFTVRR